MPLETLTACSSPSPSTATASTTTTTSYYVLQPPLLRTTFTPTAATKSYKDPRPIHPTAHLLSARLVSSRQTSVAPPPHQIDRLTWRPLVACMSDATPAAKSASNTAAHLFGQPRNYVLSSSYTPPSITTLSIDAAVCRPPPIYSTYPSLRRLASSTRHTSPIRFSPTFSIQFLDVTD